MTRRIVVLGGGYSGLTAANRLARRLSGVSITLINDRPQFVERVRLHQVASGQPPRARRASGSPTSPPSGARWRSSATG